MDSRHYSDEDFQFFLDHPADFDKEAFDQHIELCDDCRLNYKAYVALWSFVHDNIVTEPLKIDLAKVVADKIFIKEVQTQFTEKIMYGLLISLGVVCLLLCIHYLITLGMPVAFIWLLIPCGMYLWLSYEEIKRVGRKISI